MYQETSTKKGSKGFRNNLLVHLRSRKQVIHPPQLPMKHLVLLEIKQDQQSGGLILQQLSFPCLSWRRANKTLLALGSQHRLLNPAPGEHRPPVGNTFQQKTACGACKRASLLIRLLLQNSLTLEFSSTTERRNTRKAGKNGPPPTSCGRRASSRTLAEPEALLPNGSKQKQPDQSKHS